MSTLTEAGHAEPPAVSAADLVRARPETEPCSCSAIELSSAERRVVLRVAHQLANADGLAINLDGLEWTTRCAILSEAIFIVAEMLGDEDGAP